MRAIFVFKMFKIWYKFQKCRKKLGKKFVFLDNCIWIGLVKLPLLGREYLSSAVTVLTNKPKILYITKRDIFELNFLHSDYKIWTRCCREDLNSVLDCLQCCLLKSLLKREFLDIFLTTSFGVYNSEKK